MPSSEKLEAIFNRIEKKQQTDEDISVLRQLLLGDDRNTLKQLGKYNVNIGDGKEIHIGDRNYYSWDDEALSALIRTIQFGGVDEAHLLVSKLNNARLQGEEGDRKTGSFYTYNIWLEDVDLEESQDSMENNLHIQQYTIKGKWNAKVYKEINMYGFRVDVPWGRNKNTSGNFTVKIEIMNGKVTLLKVNTPRYDDSANHYAAEKAEQLIHSKISEVLRIV